MLTSICVKCEKLDCGISIPVAHTILLLHASICANIGVVYYHYWCNTVLDIPEHTVDCLEFF